MIVTSLLVIVMRSPKPRYVVFFVVVAISIIGYRIDIPILGTCRGLVYLGISSVQCHTVNLTIPELIGEGVGVVGTIATFALAWLEFKRDDD